MILSISEHAALRARQRLGWKGKSLQRMIPRVLREGVWPSAAPAVLAPLIDGPTQGPGKRFGVLFGDHAFVFGFGGGGGGGDDELVLVTVIRLQSEHCRMLSRLRHPR